MKTLVLLEGLRLDAHWHYTDDQGNYKVDKVTLEGAEKPDILSALSEDAILQIDEDIIAEQDSAEGDPDDDGRAL